jgi:chorismate mutase/prephenate dehydratase
MDLKDIRTQINKVDEQMAELFEKRMNLAKQVAKYKIENSLPIEDKIREKQLIEKNSSLIKDDEIKEYYIEYLKNVIEISKQYQARLVKGMKIAYCGVEGAFAYIASKRLFDSQQLISFSSFTDAYNAVVDGTCNACVLPLENSYAGEVDDVIDLLFSGSLFINNMISIDIVHNLIGKKGTSIKDIKKVASHPQALAQCNKYIQKHNFEKIEYSNTAIAALDLSKSNDTSLAVIASSEVAKLYDLEILETNVNESRNNTTRFAVFSKVLNKEPLKTKMGSHFILVFTVLNEAGALAKTLNIIGAHNFNMRTLRSRPMKELQWSYFFFVELEGDISSNDGKEMIKELNSVCDRLKIVGIYNSDTER